MSSMTTNAFTHRECEERAIADLDQFFEVTGRVDIAAMHVDAKSCDLCSHSFEPFESVIITSVKTRLVPKDSTNAILRTV